MKRGLIPTMSQKRIDEQFREGNTELLYQMLVRKMVGYIRKGFFLATKNMKQAKVDYHKNMSATVF